MRIFNIDDIKPHNVYRVYKDNNDLVVVYATYHSTTFSDLTPEEMGNLIEELKEKFTNSKIALEVYENEYEAKNHR